MEKLVFIEPNKPKSEPFTTSKIISQFSGVSHKYIKKQISTHEKGFRSLGLLASYATESTGGRPEEIYRLSEPQASFLMTLLKNTPVVVTFKLELVRQFYLMRTELTRRQLLREQLKPIRRELTDIIRDKPDHGQWDYKLYTDLAYKAVTGKTAAQLRKERGAPRQAKAVEHLAAAEIEQIAKIQSKIGTLLELDMNYRQIKALILSPKIAGLVA